jgi:hypothetical protein
MYLSILYIPFTVIKHFNNPVVKITVGNVETINEMAA